MKIDVTQIDGYSDMTAEEKLAALEAFEVDVPEPDYSGYVKKDTFDKTASELASTKKELKQRMSEDEISKEEEARARAELEEKYNELLMKTTISENKAKLIEIGYEGKLAESTAKAMAEGNLDEVISAQRKHLEAFEKKLKAEILKETPRPVGEGESNTMNLEKFRSLSPQERQEFYQKNPEQYRELYSQKEE